MSLEIPEWLKKDQIHIMLDMRVINELTRQ